MGTWIIIGQRGSGKNLFLTILTLLSDIPVYSNCYFKTDNYRKLSILGLYNLPERCIVILDEAYAWIDSRSSQKTINKHLSYINFQLRKTKRDIYITAQDQMSIDVRFRRIWDYLITCNRKDNGNPDSNLWDFEYVLYEKKSGYVSNPMILSYDNACKYFCYFDTYEMVDIPEHSRIEYELLKSEPREFMMRGFRMSNELKKSGYLNSYTLDNISLGLLSLGYDDIWAKLVYKIINGKINIEKILK